MLASRALRDTVVTTVDGVTGAEPCGGERRNRSDKVALWPAHIPASTPTRRSKERATATTSATPTASSPANAGSSPPKPPRSTRPGSHVQAAAGTLHLSTARFEDYFESWLAGHKPFIDPGTWNDYRTHGIKRLIPEFGAKPSTRSPPPTFASGSRGPRRKGRTSPRRSTTRSACSSSASTRRPTTGYCRPIPRRTSSACRSATPSVSTCASAHGPFPPPRPQRVGLCRGRTDDTGSEDGEDEQGAREQSLSARRQPARCTRCEPCPYAGCGGT